MNLAEVTTAAALVGVLAASGLSFSQSAIGLMRVQEAERHTWQTAVTAIEMFAREWRVAGYSAAGELLVGIGVLQPDGVEFYADLDGDQSLSGYHERIGYRWDAARTAVLRSTQGASPQPWLDNVPAEGFRLRYVDHHGAAVSEPAHELHRIRGVEVTITVDWRSPLPQPVMTSRHTLRRFVARRNPSW